MTTPINTAAPAAPALHAGQAALRQIAETARGAPAPQTPVPAAVQNAADGETRAALLREGAVRNVERPRYQRPGTLPTSRSEIRRRVGAIRPSDFRNSARREAGSAASSLLRSSSARSAPGEGAPRSCGAEGGVGARIDLGAAAHDEDRAGSIRHHVGGASNRSIWWRRRARCVAPSPASTAVARGD